MTELQQLSVPPQQTKWACPTCRRPVSTSWLFCERCGTDFRVNRPNQLATAVPLLPVPTAPSPATSFIVPPKSSLREWLSDRRPRLPRFRGARIVGGLLALILIAGAVTMHLRTRDDLHRTERSLASTEQQLAGIQADLGRSRASLAGTRNDLAAETAKLDEAQAGLDDANDQLNLQTDQIEDLKNCLGGVQSAFSYFLNDYYDSALNELYAVQTSCDRAYDLF